MTVCKLFKLLLWKNYILKKRMFLSSLLEIILPLLFSGVLISLRLKNKPVHKESVRYGPLYIDELPEILSTNFPSDFLSIFYMPPESDVVKNIAEKVAESFQFGLRVNEYTKDNFAEAGFPYMMLSLVVFNHMFRNRSEKLPLKVDYDLRFPFRQKFFRYDEIEGTGQVVDGWNTHLLLPLYAMSGSRHPSATDGGVPGYFREGFLSLQHAFNREIMHYHMNDSMIQLYENITVVMKRFPFPSFVQDPFVSVLENNFSLLLMLSFLCTSVFIIRAIVQEKERKLKEYMRIMGLNNWLHWSAWFSLYLLLFIFIISVMIIIFSLKVRYNVSVLTKSDPTLVFFFLLCFAVATISFSFMISVFFSKANLAVATGGILYFFSYLPFFYISFNIFSMTHYMKLLFCLFSNVAMALGVLFMIKLEGKGSGIQWKHVLRISLSEKFGFGEVLIMLLIDSVLYGLVTWYVEAVFPGKYGIPQPWYFFIMPSYWSGKPRHDPKKKELENECNKLRKNPFIQDEPKDLFAGVKICNLSKIFKSRSAIKYAVRNLSLNMYEGQITVLLGHNGAGKTTTLSILTGLLPATSGEAWLSGYEVSQDIHEIRKSLGLCPQHDILFDYLTVAEHLSFYVQLKGISDKDCSNEINYILNILDLENKRNTISKSLSGGMKRKVSIGIALIGGSKVVMLDEPTSGMDPVSRRSIWDLLQNQKSNRTILLTTHFMDEADLLGDRIAIMAKGELQCCGSSLFLKQKYGAGYHMVMVKDHHCNLHEIENLIYGHIPNASLESNMGAELSFILPKENVHRFEALFEELEERQQELGISSFGASVTTMEEVFLRVSKQVDSSMDLQAIHLPSIAEMPSLKSKKKMDLTTYSKDSKLSVQYNSYIRLSQFMLHCQKIYAMFIKKVLFTWRNWKMTLAQAVVPLLCVMFSIEVFRRNLRLEKTPKLLLTLNKYGRTTVPFFISKTSRLPTKFSDHLSKTIKAEGHIPLEVMGRVPASLLSQALVLLYALDLCPGLLLPCEEHKCSSLSWNCDPEPDPIEDFLLLKAVEECDTFDEQFIMAMSLQDVENQTVITTLFNNQAYHSAPMALSMVDNILYKWFFGSGASITVTNNPQPRKLRRTSQTAEEQGEKGFKGYLISISLIFGMSFMVSSFAILAISERVLRSKHIQFISGISKTHYWFASLLWDLTIIFINGLLLLVLMKVMDEKAYIHRATIITLMLHGWSVIPCMYLLSFFFSGAASGCAKLIILNIVSGIIPFIFSSFAVTKGIRFQNFNLTVDTLFQLLPNYDLAMAFSNLYYNYRFKEFCKVFEIPRNQCQKFSRGLIIQENIYAWQPLGIGKYLNAMAITGFIFFLLLFFIESNFFWKLKISFRKIFGREKLVSGISPTRNWSPVHTEPSLIFKDEDVENERERILTSLQELLQDTPLVAKELTKVYSHRKKTILAVNRISFTVQKGECFGLLGFNGAGKTSTFKMLTRENMITSGDAFINGKSILSNLNTLQGQISYCPQFDALLDHMTGRETLTMYARIWGIPQHQIKSHVNNIIFKLLLDSHADKLVRNYSGGNKRKLSTGIALLGNPSIVFLDEPSTGMDPVARRLLWNAVTETLKTGKAIIITSHSMEECEALCTRLAIMLNGHFKCLGSPQHLKSKYGSGYTLLAKIKSHVIEEEKMEVEKFKTFVKETFPGSILEEEHQGMVHYHLPKENLKWSKVFGILEEVKEEYKLEDYSISQVSLEQVFLSFAHLQKTLKED
ncbi:phospholipid-transporting ATPase ABCA3-like [Dromiciops gliroides]|uniref:phospholipid-transporting ATPase ABCA3-like n=1 Tax=Dromiciops gliroides TaxID=33562 RepID=UPI001CC4F996|nr:phospholipid-transporting ATPase ABCA3-like [Dromiciops gliroides]